MSASVSVISFNINGSKDTAFITDELYGSYDLVCLQEHLLTTSSLNFLRRSQHHTAFLSPAKVTGGRPSGGLACVFKQDIHLPSPVLFYSDEFFWLCVSAVLYL